MASRGHGYDNLVKDVETGNHVLLALGFVLADRTGSADRHVFPFQKLRSTAFGHALNREKSAARCPGIKSLR
jgi:hypothetical protein